MCLLCHYSMISAASGGKTGTGGRGGEEILDRWSDFLVGVEIIGKCHCYVSGS